VSQHKFQQAHLTVHMSVLDPSSWQRLDIILWTSSKESTSYWIWRGRWLSNRKLGWVQKNLIL